MQRDKKMCRMRVEVEETKGLRLSQLAWMV